MFIINVNFQKCTGCAECVNICPVEVYELGPGGKTNPINAGECVGCMSCVEVCPVPCITVKEM
jgi:NAD-dependent dihydropyrimidine dehydrogenase PreA subunit